MADPAGVDVPVRVLGIVLVLRNGRSVYNFLTHKTDGFSLLLQLVWICNACTKVVDMNTQQIFKECPWSVLCVCSPSRQNIIHTSTMLDISPIPSLTAMKDALRQESIRPCSNLLNRDVTSSPLTMTIISFPIHHRRRRRRLGLAWAVPRLRLAETIRNRCQLSNNKPVLASRTVHS